MDFCSKYGYNYGFEKSDSDEFSDEEEDTKKKIKKRVRKADSNIIAVKFDNLTLSNETFAGEPVKCKKCEAILSSYSKNSISQLEDNKRVWKCEFCYEENDISSVINNFDEVPNKEDVTFLVEPAPSSTAAENTSENVNLSDNNLLTLCVDISGSMDTFIPIKKEQNEDQITTVDSKTSRLDGVKIACVETLNKLKTEEPNKRVSMVTFSDVVYYYGDCSSQKPILSMGQNRGYGYAQQNKQNENPLNNKEKLLAMGHNQDENLKSVSKNYKNFELFIRNLRTEGCTALGPGLTFSIGFSSKKAGSSIILCTDGCANVGIGNLENTNLDNADQFYEDLADYAKEKGVTVNVVTMEGTDCKLGLLGKVADKTNGTLNIVNPLNLSEQFKSILDNKIIATQVKAKLIVNNKYLYIRDEELETAEGLAFKSKEKISKETIDAVKKSIVTRDLGNVSMDTEITFGYGIRKIDNIEDRIELKELPFQLQVTYVAPDGSKALRVYTKTQEFTNDRKTAEQNLLSQDLIWARSAQQIAQQVTSNNCGYAKMQCMQQQQMMQANNWSVNSHYRKKADIVLKLNKTSKVSEMADEDAEEIYKGKRMARKHLNK